MNEILVLGSQCTKSTFYKDIVQKLVDELGLEIVVKKLIDPDEIGKYGVRVGCSNAYCPGCNIVNKDNKGVQYTPALVIDGEVVFHSSFPKESAFREELEKRLK